MKLVSASLLLVVLSICSETCLSQATNSSKPRKFKHNSKVVSLYDRAKDQTTTYLQPMVIQATPGSIELIMMSEGKRLQTIPNQTVKLTAYFVSPGKTLTRPGSLVIGLRFWALEKTTYDNERKLVIRLDGARTDLGMMELMERRLDPNMELSEGRYFVEAFELAVPFSTFVSITNATNVTLTLGTTELQLKNEHLEAFRDLISRVQ